MSVVSQVKAGCKPWLQEFPNWPALLSWSKFFLPHRFTSPWGEFHHILADDFLTQSRVVATTPPECGKSTLLNLAGGLFLALEKQVPLILIISATGTNVGATAQYWLGEITDELTYNETLHEYYPFLVSRKNVRSKSYELNWETKQKSGIKLPNRTQIVALGWSQIQRGLHPQYVIMDDPESDDTVSSEHQRDKWFLKFKKVVLRMLGPGDSTKFVWVGSFINKYCILRKVIRNDFIPEEKINFETWTRRIFDAEIHIEDGKWDTFWEGSRWTKEALKRRKDEMGEVAYLTEFRHKPPEGNILSAFNRSWMHDYKRPEITADHLPRMRFWVSADAASGKAKTADFRAAILWGQFQDPKNDWEKLLFILDYFENRKSPDEVAKDIVHKLMAPYDWRMPFVQNTKEASVAGWLEAEIRRVMKELDPPKSLNAVSVMMPGNRGGGQFASAKLFNWDCGLRFVARHNFSVPEHKKERIEELCLNFPDVDKDDLVDAFMVGMRYAECYPAHLHGKPSVRVLGHEYDETPDVLMIPGKPYIEQDDGMLVTRFN